ncbi:hypothetical protein EDM57_08920 [Brevibacillus gelatini]|uniref:Uncharacterized protein n=1 Tax=Brevibacillus gelatini TaxID=1655277 RepID=A0A3M8B3G5_9BACL|nr:hypothetical protein EDM57_08920 [Brevibacillus gelatini]
MQEPFFIQRSLRQKLGAAIFLNRRGDGAPRRKLLEDWLGKAFSSTIEGRDVQVKMGATLKEEICVAHFSDK